MWNRYKHFFNRVVVDSKSPTRFRLTHPVYKDGLPIPFPHFCIHGLGADTKEYMNCNNYTKKNIPYFSDFIRSGGPTPIFDRKYYYENSTRFSTEIYK